MNEIPPSQFPPTDFDGEEKPKSFQPEKKDLSELKDRLKNIIRTISGRNNLEVTTELSEQEIRRFMAQGKNPDNAWFMVGQTDTKTGKRKEYVHIPEKILETHEDVAKGKAAHEAGHIAITRGADFIPDEVAGEQGFVGLYLAAEERPTDQVVRERFAGAGGWVDKARQDAVLEGKTLLEKARHGLGYLPVSSQLMNHIVYEPHFGEKPEGVDEEVFDLYENIRKEIELVELTLPREGASELEVMEAAKKRYKILYSKVWPKIKEVVAQDNNNEALRQMAQAAQELGGGMENEKDIIEALKEIQKELENLPDELKKELRKILNKNRGESGEEEGEEGDKEDGSEEGFGSEEAGDEKEGKGDNMGEGEEEGAGKNSKEGGEENQGEEGFEGEDYENGKEAPAKPGSPDKREGSKSHKGMSKELIEALDKIFSKLPKSLKDLMKKAAEKALRDLEDEIVKELRGDLADSKLETHEEMENRQEEEKEREAKEEERKRRLEKMKEDIKEIEKKQAAVSESTVYEKTFEEIRDIGNVLYHRLEEIFNPNVKRAMKLKASGAKLNMPAVFKWEASRQAGKTTDNRIFESTHQPEKKDYAVTMLVDLSSSMGHGKIEETFKAVVLLAEVLNRLGIKNEIKGFQDRVIDFKKFSEVLSDSVRRKLSGMIDEVYGRNKGGRNRSNYNDDGPCLLEASGSLDGEQAKEKFLFVLSDGIPMGSHSDEHDLEEAVRHVTGSTDQRLLAIGLGSDTEHVKKFYPNSLPNIEVKDLPDVLGEILEDMIVNPEKYSS